MNKFFIATVLAVAVMYGVNSQSSFNYLQGGNDWTGTCTGSKQSPIDIDTIKGACDSQMAFDIIFTAGGQNLNRMLENGTIRTYGSFSRIFATDVNGDLHGYDSMYMDIRIPGEHQIEGNSYSGEIQIVHNMTQDFRVKNPTYTYTMAIASIMISIDDSAGVNAFFSAANFGTLPSMVSLDMALLGNLLPSQKIYYTYQGSKTWPTCNENVNWYVLE